MKTILLDTSIDYTSWDINEAGSIEMTEWQPIDTAPKDGTRILLAENKIVDVGHYVDTSYEQEELVSQKGKKRIYELVKYVRGYWDTPEDIFNPTHWMPLPAPPKRGDE